MINRRWTHLHDLFVCKIIFAALKEKIEYFLSGIYINKFCIPFWNSFHWLDRIVVTIIRDARVEISEKTTLAQSGEEKKWMKGKK